MIEAIPPAMRELVGDELLQEECGVVGVLDPSGELPVAQMACMGLGALQHRGEDAAGIFNEAVRNGQPRFEGVKGPGLVSKVFPDGASIIDAMSPDARMSVGHVRWATSSNGSEAFHQIQPLTAGGLVVAQNGHIEHMIDMAWRRFGIEGAVSDGDALTQSLGVLAGSDHFSDALDAMHHLLPDLDGGYSLIVAEQDRLHAVRDPWGTRPLWMGRLATGGVVFASEEPALRAMGNVVKDQELAPGEIISVSMSGEIESSLIQRDARGGMCSLEAVYLMRADGKIGDRYVYDIRLEMGRQLAKECPVDADIVIGVPSSGTAAALGFSEKSGIPYVEGFLRNSYISRTFIQGDPNVRRTKVLQKLIPNRAVLQGKRAVVVDDSIVRGTSTETMSEILRANGVTEVHYRISSPPLAYPCFAGTAISQPETLFARRHPSQEDRRRKLNADSLGHLSREGLAASMGVEVGSVCMACMDGEYPFEVPLAVPVGRKRLPLAVVSGATVRR